jgi:hypothetical protein
MWGLYWSSPVSLGAMGPSKMDGAASRELQFRKATSHRPGGQNGAAVTAIKSGQCIARRDRHDLPLL